MLGPKDLKFNPASLGSPMLLVDVTPVYAYESGRRTDKVVGHKYLVCLPAHKMKKLGVKIEGTQQMAAPDGAVEVAFDDLDIGIYEASGELKISAKAKGIRPAKATPKS